MNWFAATLLLVALMMGGCANKDRVGGASIEGVVGKPGTSLAYEHNVSVSLPGDTLKQRMEGVREACADERFANCSLLRFEETSGRYPGGVVAVRLAPLAVEPLIGLASKEGSIGSRQTRAEDLAIAVADASRERDQLSAQRTKLIELQDRKDLAVADMISLARELAQVESGLANLNQTSASLQRRIETNLLTIQFSVEQSNSRWSIIGSSLSDSLDAFADGTSEAIGMIAFGLPFLVVLFPLALLWRWLWRRATARTIAPAV